MRDCHSYSVYHVTFTNLTLGRMKPIKLFRTITMVMAPGCHIHLRARIYDGQYDFIGQILTLVKCAKMISTCVLKHCIDVAKQ